ncbi:MAG: hypothetical protein H7Z42_04535 [Roseiflexaceae bacterium]|nr:hypothetical protein [Roseiflexaceae bacterium]
MTQLTEAEQIALAQEADRLLDDEQPSPPAIVAILEAVEQRYTAPID